MTISTEGDCGDAVLLCGVISEIPDGPHRLLIEPSNCTKFRGQEGASSLVALIKTLAESQPYISECRVAEPGEHVDWASAGFRSMGHYMPGRSLLGAHVNHLVTTKGIGHGICGRHKWLAADKDQRSKGRVVINRTARYRNYNMPWKAIVNHYRHLLLFIGLEHEHREFCGHFGWVDFQPTRDLLEVAQIIAGSELFIGNQSCANAIAEGLKHPRIQETSLQYPDCILPHSGEAQHIADGLTRLPAMGRFKSVELPSTMPEFADLNRQIAPPGMWQMDGFPPNPSFTVLQRQVAMNRNVPMEEADKILYEANCKRLPDHFSYRGQDGTLTLYELAKANAQ